MGEAKRRKDLGISPRKKTQDINLPQLDKKAIQKKVRSTLYKYPIIPFLFYGAAIVILLGGSIYFFKFFKIT
tara:strand:+ start:192 stop:407 length:216 start_codon:yes stop_codon:yes gene_type:complete